MEDRKNIYVCVMVDDNIPERNFFDANHFFVGPDGLEIGHYRRNMEFPEDHPQAWKHEQIAHFEPGSYRGVWYVKMTEDE